MHVRNKKYLMHTMTDEEIIDDLAHPDNDQFMASPLHKIMLDELTFRQIKKMTEAVDSFSKSSDKSSKILIWLTVVLLILTAALVWLTVSLIGDSREQAHTSTNVSLNSQFFNRTNTGIISDIENGEPILKEHGGQYTQAQLGNYLGYFDTIQSALKNHSLGEPDFCDSFSDFIIETSKYPEIQAYVAESQKVNSQYFVSLADLANMVSKSKNQNCH